MAVHPHCNRGKVLLHSKNYSDSNYTLFEGFFLLVIKLPILSGFNQRIEKKVKGPRQMPWSKTKL